MEDLEISHGLLPHTVDKGKQIHRATYDTFLQSNETFKFTQKCICTFCFKTAELDPSRNYLAGCHPHGVFAIGAFAVYGCDALEWDKLFVGINRQFVTLEVNAFCSVYIRIYIFQGSKYTIERIFHS